MTAKVDGISNKMNNFKAINERIVREQINQSQNWEAWIDTEDTRRRSYMGRMNWENRNGKAYLYRRIGKIGKSLGPRTPETEATLAAFSEGKQRIELCGAQTLGRVTTRPRGRKGDA